MLIKHRDGDKFTKSNFSAIWFLYELIFLFLPLSLSIFHPRSSLKQTTNKQKNQRLSHFSVQNPSVDSCIEKKLRSLQSCIESYLIWVLAVSLTQPLTTLPATASPQTAEASLLSFSPPGLLFFQWMSTLLYPFRALHKCH